MGLAMSDANLDLSTLMQKEKDKLQKFLNARERTRQLNEEFQKNLQD